MTGFVLLRVRAHRALLAAALLTVVLTTCVLAAFTAFTGAIGDAALRRTLQHQAAGRSTVEVRADVDSAGRAALDTAVRAELAGSFAGLPAQVASSTRSGPYGLPAALRPASAPKSPDPDLTLLATFDRSRLVLVSGSWPGPAARSAAEVQVAVPQAAATALRIGPGRTVTLADRLSGGAPLRIVVTGVYRPADPAAPYWHLDTLAGRGVHTVAFTTLGPMLVDDGAFGSGRIPVAGVSWQAAGDFDHVTTGRMDAVESSVRQTLTDLGRDPRTGAAAASSDLPDLLDGLRGSLLVTRSTLLIGALQLIVLAVFALLLVAQLLAEERAGETALLRARGGSRARVARLAATEALLLAVPAAVVAPLLAGPVTGLLAGTGAMARTGVTLSTTAGAGAWIVAAVVALTCALTVIAPALRATGSHVAERAVRSRRGALPGAVQAGADIGLLVLAGVAFWQLRRRTSGHGGLSAGAGGALGVDPVLVTAPALCLLAGTVLVLRLMPLAARLAERRAARGSGLAPALAGWQLARRPRRGAGAVLLLVLAVAMGMFAIGQGASWDRSQRDQAQYAVGSDIRVTGMTTPPFGQAGIFASVPGITAAAPATRDQLLLTQQRHATALIIDTRQAAGTMRFRSDLTGGRTPASLLAPLRSGAAGPGAGTPGAATAPGYTLPGSARRVAFTATLEETGPAADAGASGTLPDHMTATVLDAHGVPYDLPLGDLPADGLPHTLVLDLGAQLGTAPGAAPAGPLRLIRFDASYSVPGTVVHQRLTLADGRITDADGGVRPLGPAAQGSPGAPGDWTASIALDDSDLVGVPDSHAPAVEAPPDTGSGLGLSYTTGSLGASGFYGSTPTATVRFEAAVPAARLAGIATDTYLRALGAHVGDTVQVQLGGKDFPVRITAAVKGVPGTGDDLAGTAAGGPQDPAGVGATVEQDQDVGTLLLDLAAVNQQLQAHDLRPLAPTEWWLSTSPDATARVAAALRARSDVDALQVRDEVAAQLRADPLGAGPQAALPAAVLAAAVLAAVGFAVASIGAVRERATEFAVLRALGAPRRGLARTMAAEQGLLVLLSLVVGVSLGALLTRAVTPLIVLTAQATRPAPDLLVVLPVRPLVELLAAVLVTPVVVVLATALRGGDPAAALRRQGED